MAIALTKRRLVIILLVAAFASFVGWKIYGRMTGAGVGAPMGGGVPVTAVQPKSESIAVTLAAVGTLRADQTIVVAPEVEGRISGIPAREGEAVKRGDVLVTLDDSIDRAELAQARAELTLAKANYERADELLRSKVGTTRTRDEALSALRVGEAKEALAAAKLAKKTITAPFAGILGLRQESVGSYVKAGQSILTLSSIDPLLVDFRMPESSLPRIAAGQKIAFHVDAIPDRSFDAEVYAIDPQIDAEGRSLAVRGKVANADGALRPGLFARVELEVARRDNALIVPETAIFLQGDSAFVYRVVDGKATQTKVELGIRRPGEVEVRSGIAPTDLVVTDGQIKLRDGVPVMLPPAQTPVPAAEAKATDGDRGSGDKPEVTDKKDNNQSGEAAQP